MCAVSTCEKLVLALGAEGTPEEVGAVQHNLPVVLDPNFVCAMDGQEGLPRLQQAGPVVVSLSQHLPYAPNTFDEIVVHSTPVCMGDCGALCEVPPANHMGPVYCFAQLFALLKEGGSLFVGSECYVSRGEDGKAHHMGCSL